MWYQFYACSSLHALCELIFSALIQNIKMEKKKVLLLHCASSYRYNISKKEKWRQLNKIPKELKKNGFKYLRQKSTDLRQMHYSNFSTEN
jgi:hypothetical protein